MRIPVSFDQVSDFVDACEAYVGDAAVLFFDRHGGTSVYGIFNPLLEKPRLWNGAIDFPARPAEDEQDVKERKKKGSLVTLDKHALIANLVRLGRGLVSSVQ